MPFANIASAPFAITNWQLAILLWPFVVLILALIAMMVFWPQVSVFVDRLRRAIVGLLRGRSAEDGKPDHH